MLYGMGYRPRNKQQQAISARKFHSQNGRIGRTSAGTAKNAADHGALPAGTPRDLSAVISFKESPFEVRPGSKDNEI
jgi:hypothetical protein